jgi:formylglycine-generating enzyme required for sulfatase activity
MGSPLTEAGYRWGDESLHRRHINRSFAIATKKVTLEQFRRFKPDQSGGPAPDVPIHKVTWYDAVKYCRWLSEQEGIAEDQMCYPSVAEIDKCLENRIGLKLPPNYLARTGYRLPTEAEWEYACRAGASTSRFYGSSEEMLDRYAWFDDNAMGRDEFGQNKTLFRAVGQKKPNDFGLFDMHGNVLEWCQEGHSNYLEPVEEGDKESSKDQEVEVLKFKEDKEDIREVTNKLVRVLRGYTHNTAASCIRSAGRKLDSPNIQHENIGLRVARTIR